MNELKHNIESLCARYLSGNMSLEEQEEFKAWLNASPENKNIFQKSKKIWEHSKNRISSEEVKYDKIRVLQRIHFNQSLILRESRRRVFIYKMVAILAIPVTFALSWYFMNSQQIDQAAPSDMFCEVTAPKGHVAKCILPDGSEVWVNTGSTISYNTGSFNNETREIKLSGEAYFEVTKNVEKPFKVKTSLANILVTGTSFNVKSYPDRDMFETVLAEGGINMELNNANQQVISIVPGERAVYEAGKKNIVIEKVEADFFTAWRNGELLFKDATLNDLVHELERIYDINFHLQDEKLGEFRFRGMFSYNNNLIDALEKIKRTAKIDYYIENKEVWLRKE